jgi:ABC-type uncharacterized transport system substrate-binding protein
LNSFEEWENAILDIPQEGYNILIIGLYHTLRDNESSHVPDDYVIRWSSEHSSVPLFGIWDFTIGKGKAVGGLVNTGFQQGRAAAEIVLQIFNGAEPQTIHPVTAEEGRFLFSRHELQRWGLTIPDQFYNVQSELQLVD